MFGFPFALFANPEVYNACEGTCVPTVSGGTICLMFVSVFVLMGVFYALTKSERD
jgi:hypothetical protein